MTGPFLTKVFYFNAAHQYGHSDWTTEKNWEVFGPDSKIHALDINLGQIKWRSDKVEYWVTDFFNIQWEKIYTNKNI